MTARTVSPWFTLALLAHTASALWCSGCATPSKTERPALCDGAAVAGDWERPADGLPMELVASGCEVHGTADGPAFRHAVEATYNPDARTMIGTIRRTTVASGCVTVMQTTWVLTDRRHLTMAIVATDGACDLPAGYNEVSTLVRQCDCGRR